MSSEITITAEMAKREIKKRMEIELGISVSLNNAGKIAEICNYVQLTSAAINGWYRMFGELGNIKIDYVPPREKSVFGVMKEMPESVRAKLKLNKKSETLCLDAIHNFRKS